MQSKHPSPVEPPPYPHTRSEAVFTVCDGHGRQGTRASTIAAHTMNEHLERGLMTLKKEGGEETIDLAVPR